MKRTLTMPPFHHRVPKPKTSEVDPRDEKITQLEAVINQYKSLASQYQKEAAKYRTLYYNLLRRYGDITEDQNGSN